MPVIRRPAPQDPVSRETTALLEELLELAGRDVVDVGCGEGALVRDLTRRGARVIGVEVGEEPLRRARAADAAGGERYVHGVGEELPLETGSADLVIFRHSLHHAGDPAAALAEAARVLRRGGAVYAEEPVADGPWFALVRLIDDETGVRAAAHAAIRAGTPGLWHERELRFEAPIALEDFGALADRIVLADAGRAARLEAHEEELRERFAATAQRVDGRFVFQRPMRVDLLEAR